MYMYMYMYIQWTLGCVGKTSLNQLTNQAMGISSVMLIVLKLLRIHVHVQCTHYVHVTVFDCTSGGGCHMHVAIHVHRFYKHFALFVLLVVK